MTEREADAGRAGFVVVDGWHTRSEEFLKYFLDSPAPRRALYLEQLARDVVSWKPWAGWVLAAGCAVGGVVTKAPSLFGLSFMLLAAYLFMFITSVHGWRDARCFVGRITSLEVHPLSRAFAVAKAEFAAEDSTRIRKVAVERHLAEEMLKRFGAAEVLFIDDGRQELGFAIGIRAPHEHGSSTSSADPVQAAGAQQVRTR